MSIINITDLNLYLISFADTESIVNLSELNKESYQIITKLNLYKQIISHRKKRINLRYFSMIVYSIGNNYIELFKCLFLNDKKELEMNLSYYAVLYYNIEILELLYEYKCDIACKLSNTICQLNFENLNVVAVLQWLFDHKYLKEINSDRIIRHRHIHILIFMKKNNLKLLPYTAYNFSIDMDSIDIILWLMANHFIESELIKLIQKFSNYRNNIFKKNYPLILKCAIENNLTSFELFINEMIKNHP